MELRLQQEYDLPRTVQVLSRQCWLKERGSDGIVFERRTGIQKFLNKYFLLISLFLAATEGIHKSCLNEIGKRQFILIFQSHLLCKKLR